MLATLLELNKTLKAYLIESTQDAESTIIPFAIMTFIVVPLFYFINIYFLAPQSYSNITLRFICGLFSLLLILKNHWPNKMRRFLPLVWYGTIFISFPFFATFMTLENHCSAAWTLNFLSIIVLMMFLVDWIAYTVLLFLGIVFGSLFYYWDTPNPHPFTFTIDSQPLFFSDIVITYFVSILMGVVFSRNKKRAEHEKLQAMKVIGAYIAHELRTPLASINGGIEGAKRYLPTLIEGYELAKKNHLPVSFIRPEHGLLLPKLLQEIGAEVHSAHTIIDMLLLKVNLHTQKSSYASYSIKDCVEEALARYPFDSDEQKNLVKVTIKNDFMFEGEKLFMVHVLFNLLKNTLYAIAEVQKGEIFIWTECDLKNNFLYFKDTAKGMSLHVRANLFKKFFTGTRQGTGLGLAFCKTVMEKFGGSITCKSEEGQYVKFILAFKQL